MLGIVLIFRWIIAELPCLDEKETAKTHQQRKHTISNAQSKSAKLAAFSDVVLKPHFCETP